MIEFITSVFWLVVMLLLSLSLVWGVRNERERSRQLKKANKKIDNMHKEVANILLEKADDEKPILLKVDQEKLIEKTVDEIERRKRKDL